MESLAFEDWLIEFDRNATVAMHARIKTGGPEECGCDYCRNWAQSRAAVLTDQWRELLDRLGIPVDHEAEVVYYLRQRSGLHLYGGWYHFVGRVISGERQGAAAYPIRPMSFFFTSVPHLVPEEFRDLALAQLEFTKEVPWLSSVAEPQ